MRYDNRHSQLVAWAKIILPLSALMLLSTLFLFSHRIDPSAAIPYAKVDVERLVRESALSRPDYAGVTDDGATLAVTADLAVAVPDTANGVHATRLKAKLTAQDGLVADLQSQTGLLDPGAGVVILKKDVAMQTSRGYRMTSDLMRMQTDKSELTSPGPVNGRAPFGTFKAGSMRMTVAPDGVSHDLIFKNGVKLVYQPQE